MGVVVVSTLYKDATLVLLGHGSTKNEGSERPVLQHAEALRKRELFAEVREAFWKQPPQVKSVLEGISTPRGFIVPVFISEGYFSDELIPEELGFPAMPAGGSCRTRRKAGSVLYYTRPVGAHPSMICVLLARAEGIVRQYPFPRVPESKEISLFIAGHGTSRNENSRRAIEEQASRIRSQNRYACVHGVFMEEEPRIRDCYALATTPYVVVVPFFISDGLHAQEDIPVLLGEREALVRQRLKDGRPAWRNPTERRGKLVWYAPSIGSEPHLADVILDLVGECASVGIAP